MIIKLIKIPSTKNINFISQQLNKMLMSTIDLQLIKIYCEPFKELVFFPITIDCFNFIMEKDHITGIKVFENNYQIHKILS